MNEGSREYVLNAASEHGVKFVRLWFTDILGFLKSVAIPVEQLDGALIEGIGFDGSSVEGFARIDESDMIAMPDPILFRCCLFARKKAVLLRVCFAIFSSQGEIHIRETRAGC